MQNSDFLSLSLESTLLNEQVYNWPAQRFTQFCEELQVCVLILNL